MQTVKNCRCYRINICRIFVIEIKKAKSLRHMHFYYCKCANCYIKVKKNAKVARRIAVCCFWKHPSLKLLVSYHICRCALQQQFLNAPSEDLHPSSASYVALPHPLFSLTVGHYFLNVVFISARQELHFVLRCVAGLWVPNKSCSRFSIHMGIPDHLHMCGVLKAKSRLLSGKSGAFAHVPKGSANQDPT